LSRLSLVLCLVDDGERVVERAGVLTVVERAGVLTVVVERDGVLTVVERDGVLTVVERAGVLTVVERTGVLTVVERAGVLTVVERPVLDDRTPELEPDAENESSLLFDRLFGLGRVPEEGLLPDEGLLGALLTPPLDPVRVGVVRLTSGFLVPDGRAEEPRFVDGVRTPDVRVFARPLSVMVPRSRVVVVPLVTPLVRPEFVTDRSPLRTILPRSVN
jgi:hypothetical protein